MLSLKEILKNYQEKHWGLPAFNIDSFEIYHAVEKAVKETNLPCIVQLSPGEDSFIEAERLLMLVKKANYDGLPIYLNMDHGYDVNRLEKCLRLGFDMVHFDASKMDYNTNLTASTYFVKKIKKQYPDCLIELEFNKINLVNQEVDSTSYTDPTTAKNYVAQTGADLLAVSIGNMHGVNTLSPEKLNISLLSEIKNNLENTFLTLHGASGVPADQINSALKLGVVKVNINTDLRREFIETLRHQLTVQDTEKIYEYFTPTINNVSEIIKQKLISFTQNV